MRDRLTALHPDALAAMVERAASDLITADLSARSLRGAGGMPRRWEWQTSLGVLKPGVSRVADSGYAPEWLLGGGRRSERAVVALVVAACIRPVPPLRVRTALRAVGIENVRKHQVADLAASLSSLGARFRDRSLAASTYAYLALGATAPPGHREPGAQFVAVAAAVTPDGKQEIVGVAEEKGEDAALSSVLRSVLGRGLVGVRLVVSSDRPVLRRLIAEDLPDAAWQRSPVDVVTAVCAAAPPPAREMVASLVDTVYDQPDRAGVEGEHERRVQELRVLFPEAGSALADVRAGMLAFAAFPRAHWSLIWGSVPFDPVSLRRAAAANVGRPQLFVLAPSASGAGVATPARPSRTRRSIVLPTARPVAAPDHPAAPLAETGADVAPAARDSRLYVIASAAIAIGATVCIALTLPGPWLAVGAIAIGLCMAAANRAIRPQLITVLLAAGVATTAIDYLTWRTEVANWSGWFIAVPLLAAEIFGALHTLGLQYTVLPARRAPINKVSDPSLRPIFVLIPTVNEGTSVLRVTVQAALAARRRYLTAYQRARVTIAICNDGRVAGVESWHEVEDLARKLGVECVTRTVPGGNKAGNLENARQQLNATGDALIVIFDADQVATPDFLIKTVPPFADPSVGWVQTGQYYRNLDEPVALWANDQQALFYRVLCPGKEAHNAAFICGTNVVIRASALDEIGGLPQDSVTEDFAASIELHRRWRSVFLTDILAWGLGPMDLPGYMRQQRRWAIGTIGVLRTHWRDIALPRRGGLSLQQRAQYALACTHYLSGIRDLIYVLAPVAFLLTGIPAVHRATLGVFLWHFLPYWVLSQAAFWWAGRGVTGLRGIIIGFGSFPALVQAAATVALGRRSGFMVTSKQRRTGRSMRHLYVYMGAIALCAFALVVAVANPNLRPESAAVSMIWVIYDIVMLGGVLALGFADLDFRDAAAGLRTREVAFHERLTLAARRGVQSTMALTGRALSLRRSAPRPAAALVLLAVCALAFLSFTGRPQPVVLDVHRAPGQPVELGLSLPHQALASRPAQLQSLLCLPFTIIGRTQDISDNFDSSWSEGLASAGRQPWITLQFGAFQANGTPPLDAGLLAIENGVRDSDIERWAGEIHAYGKPVLLTILLHVDKNWAATSAVANGGIPEDVPRVWQHLQSIFKQAGDTNVGWVWAPADPSRDQPYAPPESTIDLVLQSMIHYDGTPWPDPAQVLAAVEARHPGKPILLEVSAAGPAADKASWIKQVAMVAAADPHIFGLLYHDGSPDVGAGAADNRVWSIESDASSVGAMSSWQALVPTASLPCHVAGAPR
jgi:cellulose synthase/poly-beta-1,6-N-acetylglucosamine synthase-like glycosyltransferase/transposase-like protein